MHVVAGDAFGFVAQVVAALVRHDDTKAGGGQGINLGPPAKPRFRETMQQDDRFTVFWPGQRCVETNTIGGYEIKFYRAVHDAIHSSTNPSATLYF